MSFSGTTSDKGRNDAQVELFQNIGNSSTAPRSIEMAIRAEAELFDRMGKAVTPEYKKKVSKLVANLKDEKDGFELNRKLLTGELTPEKWVKGVAPKKKPELITLQKAKMAKEKVTPAVKPTLVQAVDKKDAPEKQADAPDASTATQAAVTAPQAGAKADEKASDARPGLQRQATESSYYFFASTPAEQAKQYQPKKIDKTHHQEDQAHRSRGHSAWNKAGTWEDIQTTKWTKTYLKDTLKNVPVPAFADGSATIGDWTVTVKSASVVLVRGKVRPGFDASAKSTWTGEYKGVKVTGTIDIPEVAESDLPDDYEINVRTSTSGQAGSVVRNAVRKAKSEIQKRIAKVVEDMRVYATTKQH